MADGIVLDAGSGGATVATDDCGAAGHAQLFKLAYSADGTATLVLADANGLEVQLGAALPAGSAEIGVVGLNAAALAALESITVDLAGSTPVQFLDVDESEDEVKASAGKLHGYFLANLSAGARYVKFYDETAATCDVGTDTPKLTIPLAAGEKANLALPRGLTFGTGICVAATTGFAVADTGAPGANDVIASVFFS